jgi:hypothetical protein
MAVFSVVSKSSENQATHRDQPSENAPPNYKITIMTFTNFAIIFILTGGHLAWLILNSGRVARSPLYISLVGLAICASGFFLQTQVHRMEMVPTWFSDKYPFFSASHDTLDLIKKMIEVIIYAVGSGVIASAMVLRAQLRLQLEIRDQEENRREAIAFIEELKRNLKFAEADARLMKIDVEQRIRDVLKALDIYKKKLKDADRILRSVGN